MQRVISNNYCFEKLLYDYVCPFRTVFNSLDKAIPRYFSKTFRHFFPEKHRDLRINNCYHLTKRNNQRSSLLVQSVLIKSSIPQPSLFCYSMYFIESEKSSRKKRFSEKPTESKENQTQSRDFFVVC